MEWRPPHCLKFLYTQNSTEYNKEAFGGLLKNRIGTSVVNVGARIKSTSLDEGKEGSNQPELLVWISDADGSTAKLFDTQGLSELQ